jgi:protein SCO1
MKNDVDLVRRKTVSGVLAAAISLTGGWESAAQTPGADHDGRIYPPRPVPDIPIRCADGGSTTLGALLQAKATALHLFFAQCTTTCPIMGAVFERVQKLLPDSAVRSVQLLSLSIDPEADTPESLRKWLEQFHAREGWVAAVPRTKDVAAIRTFFGDGGREVGNHITQVQIIDRNGALIWRTFDLPSANSIAAILRKMEA